MDKPHSFAGRVIKKYGKMTNNDYAQPDKFFADMADYLRLLDGVPFSAIEDLQKYDLNRDVMFEILRRVLKVLKAAQIDIVQEMSKQHDDPFDGLEEDLAKKHTIKISGEEP